MDFTKNHLINDLNLYLPHIFPNKFKSKNSRRRVESLWNKFKKVLGEILKSEYASASRTILHKLYNQNEILFTLYQEY